jgi:hypothetical protein
MVTPIMHEVRRFESMRVALKELEQFVRNGDHLFTGQPFKGFGDLRSREICANWLICAALNDGTTDQPYVFTSDPTGGDGIIYDRTTNTDWPTAHIVIMRAGPDKSRDIATLIHDAAAKKQAKGGAAYASGKVLVIFMDAGLGEWKPNIATRGLPKTDFDEIWVVGLHGDVTESYVYGVSRLAPCEGNAPTWLVRIAPRFDNWSVERLQ